MTPSLPPGVRVYAIGDLHGCADLLDRMMEVIEADLVLSPAEEVVEVFLGDYVDRGPDSRGVLERVAQDPPGRQRVRLMGNHEDAMLAALDDGNLMSRWLFSFGGDATLRSYGLDAHEYAHQPQAMQPLARAVIPERDVALLRNLSLQHRVGDVVFVHAGIRPGVALEEQDRHDLLWIRDEFLLDPGPLPAFVVHGHTPVEAPEMFRWRANVDTGAVFGGPLTALVLEGTGHRFLSVRHGA